MPYLDLTRPDHAYFFGFLQTDGHLAAGKGQKGRVQIEVSARDVATLREFVNLLPIYSSVTYRTRKTNFSASHDSAKWTACDLGFRTELVRLGMPSGRKSNMVKPPAPPFSVRDYLRGLIDGDGSVSFTRTGSPFISFVSDSQALAEFFCNHLEVTTGAHRVPKRNTRDDIYSLMVASDPAVTFANWLYPEGCLALKRKYEAARRISAWTRPADMRARPVSVRRWTPAEDAVVRSSTIRGAMEALGRSKCSVSMRRNRLLHAVS